MTKKILSLCMIAFLVLTGCAPAATLAPAAAQQSVPSAGNSQASGQALQQPANGQQSSNSQSAANAQGSANAQQPNGQQPPNGQQQPNGQQPPNGQPLANGQQSNGQAPASQNDVNNAGTTSVDLTHLPLGDGHISTQPEVGSVWSCQTNFGNGGASHSGSWINSDGTFNETVKPTVSGSANWTSVFNVSLQGDSRIITGNGLPDHPTGNYPISPGDRAYLYDHNPNHISAQTVNLNLPANPTLASQPSCLTLGPIGIMLTGSYLFDALDAGGRDAVAHEVQDSCQGHPQQDGTYHYHSLTSCVPDQVDANGNSPLVGYALDGFGIYGPVQNGKTLTTADLDACHGITSEVEWDGKLVNMYHYVATADYPYTLGCFRGQPTRVSVGGGGRQQQNPGGSQNQQNGGQQSQNGGQQPQAQNGQQRQRPQIDFAAAASQLGVTEQALRAALGDPGQGRPDLAAAAAQLGVTEQALIAALGLPPGGPGAGANGSPPQQNQNP